MTQSKIIHEIADQIPALMPELGPLTAARRKEIAVGVVAALTAVTRAAGEIDGDAIVAAGRMLVEMRKGDVKQPSNKRTRGAK